MDEIHSYVGMEDRSVDIHCTIEVLEQRDVSSDVHQFEWLLEKYDEFVFLRLAFERNQLNI